MACDGIRNMSEYGVCNCDACSGYLDEPEPRGDECVICCAPVYSWQDYEVEESDGYWTFRHQEHSLGADSEQGETNGSSETVRRGA